MVIDNQLEQEPKGLPLQSYLMLRRRLTQFGMRAYYINA